MHAVGDRVGGGDFDAGEPGGFEALSVFGEGERAGDAADVVAAFGPLFGGEGVVGHDVGDADATAGDAITSRPLDVVRIALPLLVYFAVMWAGSMALGKAAGLDYSRATALAFTAAGNNFELAIAVAIATYGASSGQALAGVVGPLIEVPVPIGPVHVALAARRFFPRPARPTPAAITEDGPARV